MTFFGTTFRFIIAIAFDITDFFIGRITGFGTFFDIGGGFLGLWLWGPLGGAQFIEILDFTDQIDAFVPTLTLMGILKVLFKK